MAETITGIIDAIYFSSESFAAFSINTGKSSIRVAGKVRGVVKGLSIEVTGNWVNDPSYGRQFQASSARELPLRGREKIVAYLSSGFVKGIGPAKANMIYDMFQEESLVIIENDCLRLTEVTGITTTKALEIQKTHMKNKIYMELSALLQPDITEHQIRTIYEKYGTRAVDVVKDNPYRLIRELHGIGFKKADSLAKAVGIKGNDPRRIRACIHHILQKIADDDGHCFMYADSIEEHVRNLVGDVDMNVVANEILLSHREGSLIIDDENAIYLRSLYDAELQSALHVSWLLESNPDVTVPLPIILMAVKEVETKTGYQLDARQLRAVRCALRCGLSVITGGAGTGKTTIIQVILKAWELAQGSRQKGIDTSCLMSFTGRAAMRMSEVTGYPAFTIHRGLGYKFEDGGMKYTYDHDNKHPAKLIIIDEASMINIYMFRTLIQAVSEKSRIVFIGDIDQLPPVGPGNPFRDLVLNSRVPSERLQASYRITGTIEKNANRINNGQGPNAWITDESFRFIPADKLQMQQLAIREYLNLVKEYGVKNVVFLCPKLESGPVSVKAINTLVQDTLNPRAEGKPFIRSGSIEFRLGDRVMQTTNDYVNNVFNGEVGFITDIAADSSSMTVEFDSGLTVMFPGKGLSHLMLAYACTIHKSQGSEYDAGVIVFGKEHIFNSHRNLIYTGATRVKKKMRVVGDLKALNLAIATVEKVLRQTKLSKHIKVIY